MIGYVVLGTGCILCAGVLVAVALVRADAKVCEAGNVDGEES